MVDFNSLERVSRYDHQLDRLNARQVNKRDEPIIRFVDGRTGQSSENWKIKISVSPSSNILYMAGSGILDPLKDTNGVIFPYTPQITVTYQANYSSQKFTHSNYIHYAYENSEVQQIQISSEFTAQNQKEAAYVLACIYFFRAATKMFFGASPNNGSPPPLVFLTGYGRDYFPNVPCIVTSFSHIMPNEVDYIESSNTNTRIPTISTLQVNLAPVYSKTNLASFNLQDFSQGRLINKGYI